MCEWSLNNSKKVHKYFGNFLISKEAYLTKYQNKKKHKKYSQECILSNKLLSNID